MTAIPGPYGAHNWHPMSFNPQTGLVYLPAQGVPLNLTPEKTFTQNAPTPGKFGGTTGWNVGFVLNAEPPKAPAFGRLLAWDPVKQKEAWRAEYVAPWNGGTLTTAGNLVFQGTADGRFVAYNATHRREALGDPDRHRRGRGGLDLHGRRRAICIGRGRLGRRVRHCGTRDRAAKPGNGLHLRDRRQGAAAGLHEVPDRGPAGGREIRSEGCAEGTALYVAACVTCHGVPGVDKGGNVRNLGYVPAETITNLKDFVFKGPFRDQGMPDFTGKLKDEDVVKIQAFIQGTADAIRPKK